MRLYEERLRQERPLTIQGQNVSFALKVLPDNGTVANVTANYNLLVNDSTVSFLLAPFGTSATGWAAAVTERANKVLMSSTSSSGTFNRNLRRAFSAYPPVSRFVSRYILIVGSEIV
jgi:ABC-type branched-subunit amino acid transport system substrate-binding protein